MTPPTTPPLSILMYHQVGVFARPDAHRALFCHIDRFRSQLRYLKFAGFKVLKAPDVPSVLLELGYLSNSEDEARLLDEAWRADAICNRSCR